MGNILVIDDERSIRKTFEAFLMKEDHVVYTAENVDIALEIIETKKIDLILSDIIMPRITGMDLLKILEKKNSDIPVIIMTGEPTIETATLAVQGNAQDYITKPVAKDTLLKVVKYALIQNELIESKKILEVENEKYRKHLEELVGIKTEALQKAMSATVITLSSIVELRDPYTAGHERKVGNLAVAIAKKIGLSKSQIDCIYVTGYLHDIGKISVPAEFLSKPGKLSYLEFEVIKSHVMYGYDVLKKVEFPWPVAEVVYQHHERINGSGYPRGLKDDEIKIEAKILAVADVVEAMTSHRPYRASLGIDAALNEIKKNAGILYDKKIAEATVELFEKDKYEFVNEPKEITFNI